MYRREERHRVYVGARMDVEDPTFTGQRESNDLHVPAGRRSKYNDFREHHPTFSFGFRIKADVLPVDTRPMFEATSPGVSPFARYCGMKPRNDWLGSSYEPSDLTTAAGNVGSNRCPAVSGNTLSIAGCVSFRDAGEGGRGPALAGFCKNFF